MTQPSRLPAPESARFRGAALFQLGEREQWLLLFGAMLSLIVHAGFRFAGFGEQDAARLAMDAVHWHAERVIYMADVDYRLRTSPLYIHALRIALDHGLAIRLLPRVINWASVIASSVCSVGMYLLFRRFTNAAVAAAATVIYALTPCFWLGSVYGMPTLPALTCWIFATLAFARATDEGNIASRPALAYLGLSAVLAALALALKADMALSAGALLAVLLLEDRLDKKFLAAAVGIVVLAVGFNVVYSGHLASPAPPTVDPEGTSNLHGFVANWTQRFPFKWAYLVDPKNNICITHAVGSVLFVLVVLALFHGVVTGGKHTRLTLALAAWGLPAIVFWGLKSGNSARHNLPAFPGLVLLATLLLFTITSFDKRKAWLLIALLGGFSLLDETGGNSVAPKTNLLTTSELVEGSSNSLHRRAREFMHGPNPKKAIIEANYLIAYTEFEVWAAAKAPVHRDGHPRAVVDGDHETRVYQVGNARSAREIAQSLRRDGWDVFSVQFPL